MGAAGWEPGPRIYSKVGGRCVTSSGSKGGQRSCALSKYLLRAHDGLQQGNPRLGWCLSPKAFYKTVLPLAGFPALQTIQPPV